jgi:hypothetical protein
MPPLCFAINWSNVQPKTCSFVFALSLFDTRCILVSEYQHSGGKYFPLCVGSEVIGSTVSPVYAVTTPELLCVSGVPWEGVLGVQPPPPPEIPKF